MLTEPAIIAEIHSALRASRLGTVPMIVSSYVLLPAIEPHVVLTAMIPAAAAGDDADGASRGEIRGCLAVDEYGAGVVEELMGAVALKLGVEFD
ncbi:hypothetical protein G7Y79_00012g033290 [Physcia stellaris]|nr:hypothetical protein G7Y79_00012g033290 [Physcia stellaris]